MTMVTISFAVSSVITSDGSKEQTIRIKHEVVQLKSY